MIRNSRRDGRWREVMLNQFKPSYAFICISVDRTVLLFLLQRSRISRRRNFGNRAKLFVIGVVFVPAGNEVVPVSRSD